MSIGTSFAGINPVFLEELRALQREFAENAEEAENWSSAVMLELLRRQAQLVVENLQAFDVDHQGKLYESGRNLAILEDIARGMSAMNDAARENVQAEWARRAMDFRQRVQDAAPALGIQLDVPKFFGTSIQLIQGASLASFSALSDYAQLQGQVILALKTETAEGLSRGLTTTELQRRISQTGIGELPEIPGVRRAFSVDERARMIARTETLRIQTQIQRAFAEVAGLEFGRSFLNWFLTRHHELCLWAEAIGWAPVTVFQSGPGFPPRHPSCGCTWQAADAAWLEANKDELHIQEFTQNLQANNVKLPAFVLDAIPANVGDLLRASRDTFQINDRRTDIPQRPTESRMLAIDEATGGVRVRP